MPEMMIITERLVHAVWDTYKLKLLERIISEHYTTKPEDVNATFIYDPTDDEYGIVTGFLIVQVNPEAALAWDKSSTEYMQAVAFINGTMNALDFMFAKDTRLHWTMIERMIE